MQSILASPVSCLLSSKVSEGELLISECCLCIIMYVIYCVVLIKASGHLKGGY